MRREDGAFYPHEVNTIYASLGDRYIVSLIVSYSDDDLELDEELPPEHRIRAQIAAHFALELTRDEGSRTTVWFVYDRETGQEYQFEQRDIEEARYGENEG